MTPPRLCLDLLPGRYAFVRLDAREPIPPWALASGGSLRSVTRNEDELSVLIPEASVPPGAARVATGWRALRLRGPVPFETTGVIAALTAPLAAAGVPVTPMATFDTDLLFVMERHLDGAIAALRGAGVGVETPGPHDQA
jgi:hypothetical protein